MPLALLLAVVLAAQPASPPKAAQCAAWTDCRRLALEAAERKEYEAFHDLAWRAVQKGPANDPSLLFLLARAQSLSGRPHDALVMLRRVAASGVAGAALTDDDFARVRSLSGWPEVAASIEAGSAAATPAAAPPESDVATPASGAAAKPDTKPAPAAAPEPDPARAARVADALTFEAPAWDPVALAYDRVSRRFILADADVSRLAVVDEFTRHVATLASGRTGTFGTVTAVEIEPRVGNLWVASVDAERAMLHKLQLISARVLEAFPFTGAARFADLAVKEDGTVFALDVLSGRILRLRQPSSTFDVVTVLRHEGLSSIASAGGSLYVAHAAGIDRVSPGGSTTPVKVPEGADIAGLARIRWSRGALIGLQAAGDGLHRAVRVRLSEDGRSVKAVEALDEPVRTPARPALTIVDRVLYYLVAGEGGALTIRRLAL